ncbi:MAG: hypothetical protein JO350_04455 [Candidatus Eremiobacteraeota bacterium]|nr:hypothetical protein [Candidatus Eremiobacteraeota bacterium]
MLYSRFALGFFGMTLFFTGCNGGSAVPSPGAQSFVSSPGDIAQSLDIDAKAKQKIKHVIIIVQENRSLNNLFMGYPGAKTVTYGYDSKNKRVPLKPIALETRWDLAHNASGVLKACHGTGSIPGTNCRMNGFDQEAVVLCGGAGQPKCPKDHPQYAYVPRTETEPYFDMAKNFVLADEMYSSDWDASSFVSHQYIIAAQAKSSVDYPDINLQWGCPGGRTDKIGILAKNRTFPHGHEVVCWDVPTLGDELDAAGLPWAYYASAINGDGGIWSAYQTIKHIYKGPDWAQDVISPQTQFFSDVKNGNLRSVSWITPTFENSDHAGSGSNTGPSWVASLVNAVGKSQYWDSSAIFVFWDDYGGWYDSKPPAYKDYDGLGFRLPLLIVSPYAKRGWVSHVQYEHGSILRFIEDQFGLSSLSVSDARATSPQKDCFDFSKPARAFVPIKSPMDENFFLHQPPDGRLPDSD